MASLTGTIVHETGHTFGLPDLYDTSSQTGLSSYLGAWDPMSDADGEDFGSTVEFMGWHLWRLGWIDDEQVTCVEPVSSLDVTLDALTQHGDSVIAVVPTSEHRAVVIESRKAERFNAAIPRPGVLIYVVWTDTAFGPVLVGPRDGTEFPTTREGFANATLVIGDRYTDPVTGFTVTVVDSTDASDTVRIQPADAPTEPPVDPGTEPVPPADPNATPAGGTITMLPPTGMDATGAVVLMVALLLAGTLLRSSATRRRPSPERRHRYADASASAWLGLGALALPLDGVAHEPVPEEDREPREHRPLDRIEDVEPIELDGLLGRRRRDGLEARRPARSWSGSRSTRAGRRSRPRRSRAGRRRRSASRTGRRPRRARPGLRSEGSVRRG